ncbi:AtpZ/AtpI family protein [Oceaniglobus roseus]|uniref:AtpZ/AtpI family protein n=1 Tax=Oceaniglobus roseus TaxID=1737570 RepID=UPI000C7E8A99|nr:AtpZ/AtpI family protein [Kandeliimicrobium roseum]
MADDPSAARLKALEDRIAAAKAEHGPKPKTDSHYSQANIAWRMVIELVAGLGIGFGMGYGLDVLLGTLPWFMLIFVGLGLAAGVKTMMRTAKELQDEAIRAADEELRATEKRD